jgi:cell wall-associated NlpC family hydrolase
MRTGVTCNQYFPAQGRFVKGSEAVRPFNATSTRRALAALIAGSVLAVGIGVPTQAVADPASVAAKKREVRELKAKLDAIGARVGVAAERYNGARWRLSVIKERLVKNQKALERAISDLNASQRILGDRIDALYRRPDPSLVEVLVSSGSITDAMSELEGIERAGTEDAQVVGKVRRFRDRTIKVRVELAKDRESAKVEVRKAEAEKARVEAILAQRQQLLQSARADLRQAIADERARRAAQARSLASSGYTPFNGPLPDGAGNAEAARIALSFQGVPYVWGGESPSGFDCSGLATYAYRQIGKSVPHYTYAIWGQFPQVPYDQLQPGDMVFFSGLGHMGIYIGGGNMVHAPQTGDVVRVTSMASRSGNYVGAVRP